MSNFKKLQQLVQDGKLKIFSILSPGRTVSTILSKSISSHPQVDAECPQPFHLSHPFVPTNTSDREEKAYGLLLAAYNKAGHDDGRPVTVVVKEMTRNLVVPETIQRWDELASKHIITIRNPLLAIESIMRLYFNFIEEKPEGLEQFAKEFASKHNYEPTERYLKNFHNVYANHLGYKDNSGLGQHWKALAEYARTHRDYTMLTELFEEFGPFYDLNSRLEAVKKEYPNGFITSITGWESFSRLIPSLNDGNQRICIVDGSLLRASPEFTTSDICAHLELSKEDADIMLNWSKAPRKYETTHLETDYKAVLGRANGSTKLEPPTETPILPAKLPKQFYRHFNEVAMPEYLNALADNRCIRPRGKEALATLLKKPVSKGMTLGDTDPVLAYSLISTDKTLLGENKVEMLDSVRKKHGIMFFEVFDLIDRLNKGRLIGNHKKPYGHAAPTQGKYRSK